VTDAVESWRLLETWDAEPGFNMALDEALLRSTGSPCLRFYTWRPAALSLGYFQRWRDVPAVNRVDAVVRRLTGGGAIHHADELTFSIVAPAGHRLFRGEIRASYQRIHAALAAGLAELDVHAVARETRGATSDLAASGMCFQRSTDLDLVWDGAKGVGSAQRRTGGRVLHHGSIKLGRTELEGPIAAVWDHAPGLRPEELADRLAGTLAERLELALEPAEPAEEELARARERARHFTSRAFVHRR